MEFHKTSRIWILSLCLFIYVSTAYSGTITVGPGGSGAGYDYSTIQEGINAAVNGDTVIIAPGVYTGTGNKNLDFGGRAITVRSTNPDDPCVVDATIIDCEDDGRGFYFHCGEDNNSVLSGLTIENGYINTDMGEDTICGGGILCSGSSPVIKNCRIFESTVFSSNSEVPCGGGIACLKDSHPKIISCIFQLNCASSSYSHSGEELSYACGGGIFCDSQSSIDIYDSEIAGNRTVGGTSMDFPSGCTAYGAFGGGLFFDGSNTSNIRNCLIVYNYTIPGECFYHGPSMGGGIYCSSGLIITNCTIYRNDTNGGPYDAGSGIYGSPTVNDSIIWGN